MSSDYNAKFYYDPLLNKSFPYLDHSDNPYAFQTSKFPESYDYPSNYRITTNQQSTFMPSPQKTRMLEFSNPYDLEPKEEKAKKSGFKQYDNYNYVYEPQVSYKYEEKPFKAEEIKYYEPKVTYHYEDLPKYEEKKPVYFEQRDVTPYDYKTYRPLDNNVVYERVTYSPPVETTKRAHFREYKVPEVDLSNKIIGKLDLMKENISDLKMKLSNSSGERMSSKPRIFENRLTIDVVPTDLRLSSPLYLEKAERIKRSGYTPSSIKSPYRKSTTNRIFSPLNLVQPLPDTNTIMQHLESPKIYNVSHYKEPLKESPPKYDVYERPKKTSPRYESYGKNNTSFDVVIPSKNPIDMSAYTFPSPKISKSQFIEEPMVIRKPLERKATEVLDSILCIDCEQYIKAGNANLHSLFCYKTIENGSQLENNRNDIRTRLRNIIYFLNDEMARIRKKGGGNESGFWENCEELKGCLNDIVTCKQEVEILSHINKLHNINQRFDQMGSQWAQEVKKLGVKAEDDLMN